jgi:hypothetical protein
MPGDNDMTHKELLEPSFTLVDPSPTMYAPEWVVQEVKKRNLEIGGVTICCLGYSDVEIFSISWYDNDLGEDKIVILRWNTNYEFNFGFTATEVAL